MTADEILALRPRIRQFLRHFDACFLKDNTARSSARLYPWTTLQPASKEH